MVIIRIKSNIPEGSAQIIAQGIHRQAHTGVIVLPNCCELLNEVPEDQEILVTHQEATADELQALLAKVKQERRSDCETCGKYPTCYHNQGRHGVVRINCPLWRPKG